MKCTSAQHYTFKMMRHPQLCVRIHTHAIRGSISFHLLQQFSMLKQCHWFPSYCYTYATLSYTLIRHLYAALSTFFNRNMSVCTFDLWLNSTLLRFSGQAVVLCYTLRIADTFPLSITVVVVVTWNIINAKYITIKGIIKLHSDTDRNYFNVIFLSISEQLS